MEEQRSATTETEEKRSLAYAFILNMWVMKRVDETYINGQVQRGSITQDEATMILATPQNP